MEHVQMPHHERENMTFHVVAVDAMTAKKCNKKCAKLLLFLLNILLLTVPVPTVVAYTP